MVDIQFPTAENRRGKKEQRNKEQITGQKYNGLPYFMGRPQKGNVTQQNIAQTSFSPQ